MKKNFGRKMALILAATMTLCSACGSPAASGTTESDQTGTENTTTVSDVTQSGQAEYDADGFITTTADEPNVIDVVRFLGMADRSVFYNILEPLVRVENGVVVPAGAESYDVSDDGLTYTFHLRENYWEDGVKVTSSDYAEPLFRQADPENAYDFASDIYCIKGFKDAYLNGADPKNIGVETPDENTLVITLSEASPALLSTFEFYPERADYVEKYGDSLGSEADTIIGCGPFKMTSWVHNSEIVFAKSDTYWDKDNVKITGYACKIIPDSSAVYNSFIGGELDYISTSDQDYINALSLDSSLNSDLVEGARTFMFLFNNADDVFKNENVRLAFSLALDRESIVNDLYAGLGVAAYGIIPAASSVGDINYRGAVEEPLRAYSDADAAELLKKGLEELGMSTNPADLTVKLAFGATTAKMKTIGEYYQAVWENALGVNIELVFNDSGTHLGNIRSGDYQIALGSWGSNLEPQFVMTRFQGGGQLQAANADYDAAVAAAVVEADESKRLESYKQAEEILVGTAMIAPVYYSATERFSLKCIQGFSSNPFDTTGMKNMYVTGR